MAGKNESVSDSLDGCCEARGRGITRSQGTTTRKTEKRSLTPGFHGLRDERVFGNQTNFMLLMDQVGVAQLHRIQTTELGQK